ncbi:ATP-binding protein [Dehalococcoidia bacterium]|nr:ATP-binding protein [Dehalococcoidia bacterium]
MTEDAAPSRPVRTSESLLLLRSVEDLIDTRQLDLWHDGDRRPFATCEVGNHREHWPIRSTLFRYRLIEIFNTVHQKIPGERALNDVLAHLNGIAILHGEERVSAYRVSGGEEAVFIDLCDEGWNFVRVDATGWAISSRTGPRFWRSQHAKPLPVPVKGGSSDLLRRYLNIADDEQFSVVVGWLIQAFMPDGPYPLLPLSGEQGSAKSTAARILVGLTDPKRAPLRTLPENERDLMIQARSNQVLAFDNISYLTSRMSDALCRLSTGGGLSTRALYTDDEQVIFEARRPIILTGITDLVSRGDLLDRSIPLELRSIPEKERRSETELYKSFEEDKPYILGYLMDLLSKTLKSRHDVKLDALPRMADFARTGEAVSRAMGMRSGSFIESMNFTRGIANELIVESSPVGPMLRELLKENEVWVGRSSDLLNWLVENASLAATKKKEWPKDATRLSRVLKRLAPSLRTEDIEIEFDTPERRKITISNATEVSDLSDTATTQSGTIDANVASVAEIDMFEKRCWNCKSTNFWTRWDGEEMCGTCHPKTVKS